MPEMASLAQGSGMYDQACPLLHPALHPVSEPKTPDLSPRHHTSGLIPRGILLGLTFSLLVSTVWQTWEARATG